MFFNDTATTEIYTLSLHDALPISTSRSSSGRSKSLPHHAHSDQSSSTSRLQLGQTRRSRLRQLGQMIHSAWTRRWQVDRKSTRLNSSHANISYAVFCLKKKKKKRY